MEVSEVVKADVMKPSLPGQLLEVATQRGRLQRASKRPGEHQTIGAVHVSQLGLHKYLPAPNVSKHGHRLGVKGDGPPALGGLRWTPKFGQVAKRESRS